jgi:hypothetical protein
VFPWSDGPSCAGGISEVVSPEGWLVCTHWSLLPKDSLQLRSVVTHYQIAPHGQICFCFLQAVAESLHRCNSGWSAFIGQLSVVPYPQSYKISSNLLCPSSGSLVYHPAPTLSVLLLFLPLLSVQHLTPLSEVRSAFWPALANNR